MIPAFGKAARTLQQATEHLAEANILLSADAICDGCAGILGNRVSYVKLMRIPGSALSSCFRCSLISVGSPAGCLFFTLPL
jgi:hypothetical protein